MGREANVDTLGLTVRRKTSLGENMSWFSWFFVGKWEMGNYILAKISFFFFFLRGNGRITSFRKNWKIFLNHLRVRKEC